MLSLLSWERGLKFVVKEALEIMQASLLSWERGLKYYTLVQEQTHRHVVAPLVGAWIEINKQDWKKIGEFGSLLSWERGLKYRNGGNNMKRKMSLLSWERGLKYGV